MTGSSAFCDQDPVVINSSLKLTIQFHVLLRGGTVVSRQNQDHPALSNYL